MIPSRYLESMPKPPKRPRDMMQLAKVVGEIATGEASDDVTPEPSAASVLRGKARADKLSAERRKEIGRQGAAARWKGKRK